MARDAGNHDYEFQCLHGMGERLYDEVIGVDQLDKPCRIYAPVGSHKTLLAYLVRRLLENGANSSFVSQLVDENVSMDDLAADPVTRIEQGHSSTSSHSPAARPVRRRTQKFIRHRFERRARAFPAGVELAVLQAQQWRAAPMLANSNCDGVKVSDREQSPVINPANHADRVGAVIEASPGEVEAALAAAEALRHSGEQLRIFARRCLSTRLTCLRRIAPC